jgi:DNA polymerase-3 subunit delta'
VSDDTEESGADGKPVSIPRETLALFGHEDAERALLDAYRSGRIPHAWLIGGPAGIGKATLAYRMARFVLAHPDPASRVVQSAATLAVEADNPAGRRVTAQAHPDFFVLERVPDDKGKLYTVIRVEDTRRLVRFLGSTAGEGGWRVVIVDSADELNASSANALLKALEEPPPRTLFLLISHSPGRLLPTIRSRCRMLTLRALPPEQVAQATATALGRDPGDAEIRDAATASEGSVARAIALLDGDALRFRQALGRLLARLPEVDALALHALGDKVNGSDRADFEIAVDAVNGWLSERLREEGADSARMARFATAFERINRSAREAVAFNVDKKPLMFSIFGKLAEAARG